MKILVKNHIPFKYIKNITDNYKESWDWPFEGASNFALKLMCLYSLTDRDARKHNFCCLAIDNNNCVGHLLACVANKPKCFHPILFVINNVCFLLLMLTKSGRKALKNYGIYEYFTDKAIKLGKCVLEGKKHNISQGFSVAVDKEY